MNRRHKMPRHGIKLTLLAPLLLLAGCSAHYRIALDEYQQAKPPVYSEKTLEWTSLETSQTSSNAKLPTISREATTGFDKEVEIIARVLQKDKDFVNDEVKRLRALKRPMAGFEDNLELDALLLRVALRNPAIRSERERWQATLHQYTQADYLEGLISQYRAFTRYLNITTGKPMNKGMAQRFFPYPGMITLKGELVFRQALLAELAWEHTLRDQLIRSSEEFFELQYLVRIESTVKANISLIEGLISAVNERYRSGKTTQADLLKVQTDLERQKNMLEDIRSKQEVAKAKIVALLDTDAAKGLGLPVDRDLDPIVLLDESRLTSLSLKQRQEVNVAKQRIARIKVAIRLGETMNRPLATRGYSLLEREIAPEASVSASSGTFGEKVKFKDRPLYAQSESYLAEMRERLESEKSKLNEAETQTRSMARIWLQNYDMIDREKRLIEEIVLPQSQSAYEISLTAYSSGSMSFIDLLDAEKALIKARLELDQARKAFNLHRIRYVFVSGVFFLV